MKTISVQTESPYSVRIGTELLAEVDRATNGFSARAVLTDANVMRLYGRSLAGLERVPMFACAPGEASKKLTVLEQVLEFMADSELDRESCLVAFGGGVVGDVGGLAASLYMRGIALVQVPTTLLSQVDSSVGGKTAVNLEAGKNLAGTFHQPRAVLADTSTLESLTDAEYRSGLGEVLKTAILEGEDALSLLERTAPAIRARDASALEDVVASAVRTKAAIVSRDPTEQGERKKLNLGHTFAHGIEHAAGYGVIPHGLAVAVGVMLALRASRDLGMLEDAALLDRTARWLAEQDMPHDVAALARSHGVELSPASLLAGMRHDKKGRAGRARLVLPRTCGRIEIDVDVDASMLERVLSPG